MSRQSVRAGICTYLGGPQVAGQNFYQGGPLSPALGTLFRSFPKEIPEQLFDPGRVGVRSGAVMIVYLTYQTETRTAVGGPTSGKKRRDYTVNLHLFHRSRAAHAEVAQDDLDLLIDSITALIEADRTLGGACWQAGESGGLPVTIGEPNSGQDAPQITETYAGITFHAIEYLTT